MMMSRIPIPIEIWMLCVLASFRNYTEAIIQRENRSSKKRFYNFLGEELFAEAANLLSRSLLAEAFSRGTLQRTCCAKLADRIRVELRCVKLFDLCVPWGASLFVTS